MERGVPLPERWGLRQNAQRVPEMVVRRGPQVGDWQEWWWLQPGRGGRR